MKHLVTAIALAGLLVGCSSDQKSETAKNNDNSGEVARPAATENPDKTIEVQYEPTGIQFSLAAERDSLAGISFRPVEQWTTLPASGMRKAQWYYGPLEDEKDSAVCVVYYFGPASGGGVQANLDRWIKQMTLPDGRDPKEAAIQYTLDVDGMTTHVLSLYGTYNESMTPMGGNAVAHENYRMAAVIFEGPQGSVFFKLTGPDYTARAMIEGFMPMIKDVKKVG